MKLCKIFLFVVTFAQQSDFGRDKISYYFIGSMNWSQCSAKCGAINMKQAMFNIFYFSKTYLFVCFIC